MVHEPGLFQSRFYWSNHHKWDSQIARSTISYNLIEPQPLPCTPSCGHKLHALSFQPHLTLQHHWLDPHLQSDRRSVVELFCGNSQRVKAVGCFRRRAPSLMHGNSVLGECFHHWITQGNLYLLLLPNSFHSLILFFHWIDKAKNLILNSWNTTLLKFHFPGTMLRNFVSKFYTHFLE